MEQVLFDSWQYSTESIWKNRDTFRLESFVGTIQCNLKIYPAFKTGIYSLPKNTHLDNWQIEAVLSSIQKWWWTSISDLYYKNWTNRKPPGFFFPRFCQIYGIEGPKVSRPVFIEACFVHISETNTPIPKIFNTHSTPLCKKGKNSKIFCLTGWDGLEIVK